MLQFKKGDKVLLGHFTEPQTVDYVRKDGLVHLEGDPHFVFCESNCLKFYKEKK